MLEAGFKALRESACNVQLLQELAHEVISAMIVHIGDAVHSTGKTELQDKAAALLGTLVGQRRGKAA